VDYSCAEPNSPFGTVSPVAGGLWRDSYQALVKLQRQAADPAPKVCSRACIATLPHDLGPGIVLSADIVSRHFMHVPQGGGSIDATASALKYFERARISGLDGMPRGRCGTTIAGGRSDSATRDGPGIAPRKNLRLHGRTEAGACVPEKRARRTRTGLPGPLQSPELASLRPNARFAALRRSVNLNP